MKSTRQKREFGIALAMFTCCLSACGPELKEWEPDKHVPKVYGVAFRQLPPEPVYNRARWVHLPEVLPPDEGPSGQAPMILPILHLQYKNAKFEEVAMALASSAKYTSYCASTIATQKVSINSLGTLEELASELAAQKGAKAVIDHSGRHISFVASLPDAPAQVQPSFLSQHEVNAPTGLIDSKVSAEEAHKGDSAMEAKAHEH